MKYYWWIAQQNVKEKIGYMIYFSSDMPWDIIITLNLDIVTLFITSTATAVAKYCDEHVCGCVCLSVCLSVCPRGYIQNHTRDLHQFFCACCLWPWLGPPPTGWRNSKRKGQLWGLSGPFKSIGNIRCSSRCRVRFKRDHSIANNVMQQKGSFSMPGKR